jgi:hypothetical protein
MRSEPLNPADVAKLREMWRWYRLQSNGVRVVPGVGPAPALVPERTTTHPRTRPVLAEITATGGATDWYEAEEVRADGSKAADRRVWNAEQYGEVYDVNETPGGVGIGTVVELLPGVDSAGVAIWCFATVSAQVDVEIIGGDHITVTEAPAATFTVDHDPPGSPDAAYDLIRLTDAAMGPAADPKSGTDEHAPTGAVLALDKETRESDTFGHDTANDKDASTVSVTIPVRLGDLVNVHENAGKTDANGELDDTDPFLGDKILVQNTDGVWELEDKLQAGAGDGVTVIDRLIKVTDTGTGTLDATSYENCALKLVAFVTEDYSGSPIGGSINDPTSQVDAWYVTADANNGQQVIKTAVGPIDGSCDIVMDRDDDFKLKIVCTSAPSDPYWVRVLVVRTAARTVADITL